MNGHDFGKNSTMPFLADWVPIMSRSCRMRTEFVPKVIGLRADSVPIITNMATVVWFQMRGFQDSRHHRFTVLSLSVLCRIAFGRIGTLSGLIRLETAISGRFRNNIGLMSWLNKYFYNFVKFPSRITRSWSDFWQQFNRGSRIKVGSKNRECVTEA